ncbi:MAG: 3-phosphoshikimate 1-carboxyvinyltransferase [Acutalibacteraceae bacterium]
MDIQIFPSEAKGSINAPPSKSCAHRLLIASALAKGESVIENIGTNEDIKATVDCLKNLGANIVLKDKTAYVTGINQSSEKDVLDLYCNESGSTLRFLIPLSLAFARKVNFTGNGRLLDRPQTVYEDLFKNKGCYLEKVNGALVAGGTLKGGIYEIPGNVSSQFLTGLLFTLPLLKEDSEIFVTTPLQSVPYVDITIDVLSQFGIETAKKSNEHYLIKGSQEYKPVNTSVEGDWSNSAFLDAFNLLGGNVTVKGVRPDSFQGDKVYREFYKLLNYTDPTLDISNCPDLGPILIAVAAAKHGATLTGTKRLRIKESDRGAAMQEELLKFGVKTEVSENTIIIPEAELKTPTEPLNCHNDHRIAMSLSVLCSKVGGILKNTECVNKSYPDFFKDISKLQIKYTIL